MACRPMDVNTRMDSGALVDLGGCARPHLDLILFGRSDPRRHPALTLSGIRFFWRYTASLAARAACILIPATKPMIRPHACVHADLHVWAYKHAHAAVVGRVHVYTCERKRASEKGKEAEERSEEKERRTRGDRWKVGAEWFGR